MPPDSEAQAWWAEVQHVRESIERRRAHAADSDALTERRFSRAPADSLPQLDDLDWSSASPAYTGAHIDHGGNQHRTDGARPRFRRAADAHGSDHGDAAAGRQGAADRRDAARGRSDHARDRRDAAGDRQDAARHRHDPGHDRRDPMPSSHSIPSALAPLDTTSSDAQAAEAADRAAMTPGGSALVATSATAPDARTGLEPPPARRTVQITGRTVPAPPLPRLVEVERRRPSRRPVERIGPRPDRIAMWAVLLGFFLILVAATSSHAATAAPDTAPAAALHAPAR